MNILIVDYREGDILVSKDGEEYHVSKILRVDRETLTYHAMLYTPVKWEPTIETLDKLEVWCMHTPIATFPGSRVLVNVPVQDEELDGFFTYLRMTNFKRYLQETGRDLDVIVAEATLAYRAGNTVCEEGKFEDGINAYSEAIELFPLFWEAIDNRGLTYMDLGEWDLAIADFEESLRINPDGLTAVFSIGECLFKLGKYETALVQFMKAIEIAPNDPIPREWYDKTYDILEDGE